MKKAGRSVKNRIFLIVIALFLIAYIVSMLFPLLWAAVSSLRKYGDFVDAPLSVPKRLLFDNYAKVFSVLAVEIPFGDTLRKIFFEEMLVYSFVFAGGCALISTMVPCLTAYCVAKYKYKFGKYVYAVVIVTMILPIVGALPSEIQIMRALGLYDTIFGVFLLKANFLGIYFLIFYAAFKSLPWEFAESAFVDGAGHFRVLFRIMLPMVLTTVFAVFLLNFIMYWNDYTTVMIYMPSFPTVAFGLFYMRNVLSSSFGNEVMQFAGCMTLSLPLVILFVAFQKRLMGNLTMGGIKG
jgi:raffinose/stachyose/melibiose transport system permease protein/N-acetylglucosamine transport system permease protein